MSRKIQAKYFDPLTREWQEDTFISDYSETTAEKDVKDKIRAIGGERILIKSNVKID